MTVYSEKRKASKLLPQMTAFVIDVGIEAFGLLFNDAELADVKTRAGWLGRLDRLLISLFR